MTHDYLVERAARWLRNTKRCGVVLTEFTSGCREVPDAIGWTHGGKWSYLVECKTTRSDFYADKKKPGRIGYMVKYGIGRERYYLAPRGILSTDLIETHRPRWGLLEVRGRQISVALKAKPFDLECHIHEMPILYSYARRIHQYGLSLDEAQSAVRCAAKLTQGGLP